MLLDACLQKLETASNDDEQQEAADFTREAVKTLVLPVANVVNTLNTSCRYLLDQPDEDIPPNVKASIRVAFGVAVTSVQLHHPERIVALYGELHEQLVKDAPSKNGVVVPFKM